jgi:hypothetical protein
MPPRPDLPQYGVTDSYGSEWPRSPVAKALAEAFAVVKAALAEAVALAEAQAQATEHAVAMVERRGHILVPAEASTAALRRRSVRPLREAHREHVARRGRERPARAQLDRAAARGVLRPAPERALLSQRAPAVSPTSNLSPMCH